MSEFHRAPMTPLPKDVVLGNDGEQYHDQGNGTNHKLKDCSPRCDAAYYGTISGRFQCKEPNITEVERRGVPKAAAINYTIQFRTKRELWALLALYTGAIIVLTMAASSILHSIF